MTNILNDPLAHPGIAWSGKLVISSDGLQVGAINVQNNDGGTWAWLLKPAKLADWLEAVTSTKGDLDRASDIMSKKFGGYSGYRPTNWKVND